MMMAAATADHEAQPANFRGLRSKNSEAASLDREVHLWDLEDMELLVGCQVERSPALRHVKANFLRFRSRATQIKCGKSSSPPMSCGLSRCPACTTNRRPRRKGTCLVGPPWPPGAATRPSAFGPGWQHLFAKKNAQGFSAQDAQDGSPLGVLRGHEAAIRRLRCLCPSLCSSRA